MSPAAASRAERQQVRLARTVAITVTVLAVASALSGYLLHGRAQSARATPGAPVSTTAARPVPSSTHSAVSPTPTTSKTPESAGSTTKSMDRPTASAANPTAATVVPNKGNGIFTPVAVPETTTASTGRVITYSLRVEGGMHADAAAVASDFGKALLDRRGWQGVDHVRFVQITPAQLAGGAKPQVTVLVASPASVDKLCAPLPTDGKTSCDTSQHVVLNYKLWMQGVTYFKGMLAEYREYMVNHEVGHALGHGHQKCSAPGAYAPVMEQQTLGLQGCQAWPWPKRPNSAGQA